MVLKISYFGLYLRFLSSSSLGFSVVPWSIPWLSVSWESRLIKTVIPKELIQKATRPFVSFVLLCYRLLAVGRLTQCLLSSTEVSGRQPLTRMRRGGCDVRRAGQRLRPWHRSRACRVEHAEEADTRDNVRGRVRVCHDYQAVIGRILLGQFKRIESCVEIRQTG